MVPLISIDIVRLSFVKQYVDFGCKLIISIYRAVNHTYDKAGNGQNTRQPDEHMTQTRLCGASIAKQLTLLSNDQRKCKTHAVHCALQTS